MKANKARFSLPEAKAKMEETLDPAPASEVCEKQQKETIAVKPMANSRVQTNSAALRAEVAKVTRLVSKLQLQEFSGRLVAEDIIESLRQDIELLKEEREEVRKETQKLVAMQKQMQEKMPFSRETVHKLYFRVFHLVFEVDQLKSELRECKLETVRMLQESFDMTEEEAEVNKRTAQSELEGRCHLTKGAIVDDLRNQKFSPFFGQWKLSNLAIPVGAHFSYGPGYDDWPKSLQLKPSPNGVNYREFTDRSANNCSFRAYIVDNPKAFRFLFNLDENAIMAAFNTPSSFISSRKSYKFSIMNGGSLRLEWSCRSHCNFPGCPSDLVQSYAIYDPMNSV